MLNLLIDSIAATFFSLMNGNRSDNTIAYLTFSVKKSLFVFTMPSALQKHALLLYISLLRAPMQFQEGKNLLVWARLYLQFDANNPLVVAEEVDRK